MATCSKWSSNRHQVGRNVEGDACMLLAESQCFCKGDALGDVYLPVISVTS